MTSRLRDMIRAVRACKTAAEERGVIAKECAALRNAFKDNEHDYRHRNVAKLMFIHMLGYPTHFGQMECLKLIAAPGFPEKRIGYLGLMLLLDERQEVLMLVTNSLKNDLNHTNQFITGLALCSLANICSSEMARDLAPEVERLLASNNSYIRKKAALCAVRIIRKVPDLVENFINPATSLLTDKHHGVLLAGVQLATELCVASPAALEHYRKHTPTLVRVLKNLVISGYAPEYDVGGITDPFLQIRVLKLLKLVGKGDPESSDIMSDILAQVATNTEANKNAGNAILYECVNTIMGVEAIGGLRVLAINILGRFLANRDNNIRYVALNTLVKVVTIDTQAVQRHRSTIVECVKDSDVSIRRRALELVYALVNESNIKALTKELLEYLKVTDPEFKPDLTNKICSLVQRFSPTKLWHLDIMVKVLGEAGSYVQEDVIRLLIVLITNAPELHGYAVRSFYKAFARWKGQESLALVTVWCVGEYGEMMVNRAGELETEDPITVTESDAVDVVESVLKDVRSSAVARAYALTALLKLTSRFPSCTGRIQQLIGGHSHSLVLELQQRAVEFGKIITAHDNIKPTLVDKMPALDEVQYRARRDEMSGPMDGHAKVADKGMASISISNGPPGPKPGVQSKGPQLMDLLDLSADDGGSEGGVGALGGGGGALLDMLGGGFGGAAPAASAPGTSNGGNMLLNLLSLGDSSPAPPPPAAAPTGFPHTMAGVGAAPRNPLGDLMGGAAASPPPLQAAPTPGAQADPFADPFGFGAPAPIPSATAFPDIVALEKGALKVVFQFSKSPGNPQGCSVKALYTNLGTAQITDFVFQAAVPKFMQLVLEPATSTVVAPGGTPVSQVLQVTNTLQGQKAMVMKLRISYKVNGVEVLEQSTVNNFPSGL